MQTTDTPGQQSVHDNRERRATLAAGFFTNGVWDMTSVLIPLYCVAVGLSVAEIGLIVAARSVLPAVFSIHGGILMDRWGIRKVLVWLALASVVLPLLYPASGWFTMLVLLQLVLGLASSLANAAAQTWSLQSSHGDTAMLAHFSLVSRLGTFVAPVMVGAVWDAFGAWAAFACISLWAAGNVAAAGYAAPASVATAQDPNAPRPRLFTALIPRWTEHRDAFALAVIPAVAFVLGVSLLRNAPGAIQASFYVVYLGDVGLSGTMIGLLVGVSELFGVVGSLAAAPLERVVRPHWLVVACIGSSVTAIAATPLVSPVLALLFAAAAVRGVAQGLSQPLMYSLLGRAVPPTVHGATVGLRNSVTRLASIVIPAIMGVVAEAWGIETSFYVMGAILLIAATALAMAARSIVGKAGPPD